MDHPDGHADTEEYRAWLEQMAEARAQLPNDMRARSVELEAILRRFDTFDILAQLTMLEFGANPETYKEYEDDRLAGHVEYATQLCLKGPYSEGEADDGLDSETIEQVRSLIREIYQMARTLRIAEVVANAVEPVGPALLLRERTISHELYQRAPGFACHLEQVLLELFGRYEEWLIGRVGFCAADAAKIGEGMTSLINERFSARLDGAHALKKVLLTELDKFRAGGEDAVEAQYRDPVRYLAKDVGEPVEKRAEHIAANSAFSNLGTALSFTAEELAEYISLPSERVDACLRAFVLPFGSERQDFHRPEPIYKIRSYPLLEHRGRFLLPCPGHFLWSIQAQLEEALKPRWESYQKWRSKYLEQATLTQLSTMLRHVESFHGLHYRYDDGDGEQDYEVDGLVLFDDIVFVVEAKAGTLSASARRGAEARIKDKLTKLIANPFQQGRRAERYIRSTPCPKFVDSSRHEVIVDASRLRRTFHVCVTLDTLGTFTTALDQTAELGIFGDGPLPWVVSLLDLMPICELIEFPSQFVHFLRRRLRLNELKLVDATDELDWLGCYFHNGLYFENLEDLTEERPDYIMLQTFTTEIEEWYAHRAGIRYTPSEKPCQSMPAILRQVIAELEEDHQLGYSTGVCELLDFDGDTREKFVSLFTETRRRSLHDHRLSDFTIASSGESAGVTCFAVPGAQAERWAWRLMDRCMLYKYQCRANRWLGLLSVVDRPHLVHLYTVLDFPWAQDADMDRLIEDLRRDGFFKNLGETPHKSHEARRKSRT